MKRFSHILCIAGPLLALSLLGLRSLGIISADSTGFAYLLFLLCPLSHILILPVAFKMFGKNKEGEKAESCH